jgi:hypothetical protein
VTDHYALASQLPLKVDYTNTFLTRFPTVDICDPPKELLQSLRFVICSDVLEHVPPPADVALRGIHSMLIEPNGFAVLTVPIGAGIETDEYYPNLTSWTEEYNGNVRWFDSDGREHVDLAPEYHGGEGRTLAFRRWSEQDLIHRLIVAGFTRVHMPLGHAGLGVPDISGAGLIVAFR